MHSLLALFTAAFQFVIELIVAAVTHFGAWLFFGAIALLIFLPYIAPATQRPEPAPRPDNAEGAAAADQPEDQSEKKLRRLFYLSMISDRLKRRRPAPAPPQQPPIQINIVAPAAITHGGDTHADEQMKVITQAEPDAAPPENSDAPPPTPAPRRAAKIKT